MDTSNPEDLFKLFFDKEMVDYYICKSSNEHAEVFKDSKLIMYKYYNYMSPVDFHKMVAILIHLGYNGIPRYHSAWYSTSLCNDSFAIKVFSQNKFESMMIQ